MTIPHLGFVGGLLYAVRKAGRAPPPEPPDHLRCPISCDLYDDPVLLSQTGHTYDRVSIERWLRQKSPPTDPASNVELHSTATVPNWALRDAVNEWRAQNGNAPLQAPECATRRLAGGANARDGLSVGFAGVSLPGFGLNNVWAHGTNTVLGGTPRTWRSRFDRCGSRLGRPARAHAARLERRRRRLRVRRPSASFFSASPARRRTPPRTSRRSARWRAAARRPRAASRSWRDWSCAAHRVILFRARWCLIAPAQNALWWAGVFSAVWFANGGFVDPIRADAARARARAARARIIHSWTKRTRGKTGGGTGGCGCSRRCSGRGACGTGTEGEGDGGVEVRAARRRL